MISKLRGFVVSTFSWQISCPKLFKKRYWNNFVKRCIFRALISVHRSHDLSIDIYFLTSFITAKSRISCFRVGRNVKLLELLLKRQVIILLQHEPSIQKYHPLVLVMLNDNTKKSSWAILGFKEVKTTLTD